MLEFEYLDINFDSVTEEISLFRNHFLKNDQSDESKPSIVFIPIRHHSPSCAIHLHNLLSKIKPDVILIEGRSDANLLVPVLQNNEINPPIAIFDYLKDDKNIYELNGELTPAEEVPFKFYSWYPFATFSPEFESITLAKKLDIPAYFIDIGLEYKLNALKDSIKDKENKARKKIISHQLWSDYNYVNNSFIQNLIAKSQSRDFNEFWYNNFEISGPELTDEEFFTGVFSFGTITRNLTPNEILSSDGTLVREEFMVNQISEYAKSFKNIAVVTGAFHTLPLLEYDFSKKPKKLKSTKESKTALVTPYSYYELSELSGYQAGINFPNFCYLVYNEIVKKEPKPFSLVVNNLLSLVTKTQLKSYYTVSTADVISAYHLAINLASLRGREDLSPYDMIDSIQSTFIKEELQDEVHPIIKQVQLYLTGSSIGYVPANIMQLPIEKDFYEQCKKLRLPLESAEKTIKCEIYKRDLHRNKSRFLWQTVFLGIPFAELKTGPNYVENTSLWLLTEQWIVKWDKDISFKFTSIAPYGTTIEGASIAMFKEYLEKTIVNRDNALFGRFLIKCVQMGHFQLFDYLLELFQDKLETSSFIDLMSYLKTLVVLYGFRDSLIPPENRNLQSFIQNTYTSAIQSFSTFSDINEDLLDKFTDNMRLLSQLINDPLLRFLDKDALLSILKYSIQDDKITPKLLGVYYGFLFSFGEVEISEIEYAFNSLVSMIHTDQNQPVYFLEGLISLTKKIMFSGSILTILVNTINTIEEEKFLQLLPGLRRIFTVYMPKESYDLANLIAQQIGQKDNDLQKQLTLSPESILQINKFDHEIQQILIDWKLL